MLVLKNWYNGGNNSVFMEHVGKDVEKEPGKRHMGRCDHPMCWNFWELLVVSLLKKIRPQLWPEIPVRSTNKTPLTECIVPFITSYN